MTRLSYRRFLFGSSLTLSVVSLLSVAAQPAPAVTFRLVGQLDAAALMTGKPGSVAAYGNDVYVGGLFSGGQLHHITNPTSSPMNVNTFGGSLPSGSTNGYVSLNTDGTTLVAATNNGGADPDVVQVYAVGSDTLNWASDSAALAVPSASPNDRFDGAAVDPIFGNVLLTAFGSGTQWLFDPVTGTPNLTPTTSLFDGGTGNVGTGFRDVDFDNTTGDIFLRAVNGVARGRRDLTTNPGAPGDYDRLDGVSAGVETIVQLADGFNSAINVEFLPSDFAGQELVIFNLRNNPNTFTDQVLVYDATAVNVPVPATFQNSDGTPFTTANAEDGIYDFSYDPVNSLLYISDFSSDQIHIFEFVPEPSGGLLSLATMMALAIARRRQMAL